MLTKKAIAAKPRDGAPRLLLAEVYVAKGWPGHAVKALKEFLRLEPENPEALAALNRLQGAPYDWREHVLPFVLAFSVLLLLGVVAGLIVVWQLRLKGV